MSIPRYAILVSVLVVLGLVAVYGHLRRINVGRDIDELRKNRDTLVQQSRSLERRIDAIATPSEARRRVESLNLNLTSPKKQGSK